MDCKDCSENEPRITLCGECDKEYIMLDIQLYRKARDAGLIEPIPSLEENSND